MKIIGLNIQTGLFTSGFIISDKLDVSSKLTKETGTLFDGDPIFLPLPPEAPPEFPRLILKNKDETYSFQATATRFDLFFNNKKMPDSKTIEVETLIKKYVDNLRSVVSAIKKVFQPKIIRLGFVLTFQFQVDNAVKIIKNSYIKDLKFTKNNNDLNAGFLNKKEINRFSSNIWFRVKAAKLKEEDEFGRILLASFDINTRPDIVLDLDEDNIIDYINSAWKYLDDNLKVFLPKY
ncbi:hypothetical protein A2966_04710 [Candidatus Roizmanbacteria bacterium RIFCSPLOWO2_01_FULL_41_22]|uniref:TIGR04255 family protein n=2 Tax=Candidatus Roizmaniibacteriota TaxID=1752723 RepID=A0A1F7JR41_9BACT|nr:MAG: hypothetical protein A2966_04710 [Candidatus Roizmanbacteria bacterium RIFCSPLOWO2_01_FULL_41_22]OGK58051.1 MAG: hypothetical protein A3H86_00915 [Candidatus Roizmanbacteria bacterium RIFCSPLOWO2_02_FULL_41_9]